MAADGGRRRPKAGDGETTLVTGVTNIHLEGDFAHGSWMHILLPEDTYIQTAGQMRTFSQMNLSTQMRTVEQMEADDMKVVGELMEASENINLRCTSTLDAVQTPRGKDYATTGQVCGVAAATRRTEVSSQSDVITAALKDNKPVSTPVLVRTDADKLRCGRLNVQSEVLMPDSGSTIHTHRQSSAYRHTKMGAYKQNTFFRLAAIQT